MDISGDWFNELGSKMTLAPDGANQRRIHGIYHTAVGTAQERQYELVGLRDAAGGESQTIGWVVCFDPPDESNNGQEENGPTTCAWSGQVQTLRDAESAVYITTTWLLTGAVPRDKNWTSLTSGTNYFFRTPPTPELVGKILVL